MMTDEQRGALCAKQQEIDQARLLASRLYEQQSPYRGQALTRLDRFQREYDDMYAEATGS
jgi:hypothetical protein